MLIHIAFLGMLATTAAPRSTDVLQPVSMGRGADHEDEDSVDEEESPPTWRASKPRRHHDEEEEGVTGPDSSAPIKTAALGGVASGCILSGLGLTSMLASVAGGGLLTGIGAAPACLMGGCAGVTFWGGLVSHGLFGVASILGSVGGSVGSALLIAFGARKFLNFRTPVLPLITAALVPLALGWVGSFLFALPGMMLGSVWIALALPSEIKLWRVNNSGVKLASLFSMIALYSAAVGLFMLAGMASWLPMTAGTGISTGLTAILASRLGRHANPDEEEMVDWVSVPPAVDSQPQAPAQGLKARSASGESNVQPTPQKTPPPEPPAPAPSAAEGDNATAPPLPAQDQAPAPAL